MTSQQIKARLERAITVIAMCERVFEQPEKAARRGWDEDAQYAIRGFMDAHRQELLEGGQP